MKANKIMIDDYLYNSHNMEIFQVKRITTKTAMNNDGGYLNLIDLKPIPFTTDILSKLGFEIRENNTAVWKKLTEDSSDFEEFILIDLEIPSLCRVERNIKPKASFEGTIKYVHELQHAIKLVNVSLEIKL